nr:FAD-dependent oxidoreductase [Candidatus Gracilibacteria bacterium]
MIKDFKLTKKTKLTIDVFEMIFEVEEKFNYNYGQFITFILPNIGGRAYSMLDVIDGNKIKLIIKRLENGRGGSKFICDSEIGTILKGVGPAGHFILRETKKSKLFIGTGTGFVPLYNQIIGSERIGLSCKIKLLFGLRTDEDIFYEDTLIKMKNNNSNFDFEYYISREHDLHHKFGRVTDFITKENIADFEEFYICGNPYMIDDSIQKLLDLGVSKEQIFTEKF